MNSPLKPGLLLIFLCAAMAGCDRTADMRTVGYTADVEIAPGRWLVVDGGDWVNAADLPPNRGDPYGVSPFDALKRFLASSSSGRGAAGTERSSLSFEWSGKQVTWQGKEIPVALREHDGTLYMIGFNRADIQKTLFVYLQLNAKGTGFRKIKPKCFPKEIATQNMWLQGLVGKRWVELLPELQRLDVDGKLFDWSMTAYIWYQLVEGVEHYQMPFKIPRDFLREYVTTYKPVALPTLVREKAPGAAPKEPPEAGGESGGPAAEAGGKDGAPGSTTRQAGKP